MFLYSLFSLIGVLAAACVSRLLAMPKPSEKVCMDIYIAGAIGLIIGAKLPVWISYGFTSELILSGKSVMGGILGAFIALHVFKLVAHHRGEALGGRFAIPLAVAVGFGKIGCWTYGCCGGHLLGLPVQLVESAFQFACAGGLYLFYRRTMRADLLFPLYMLAYLTMRFGIEFVRTEPRLWGDMTIYQWMSVMFVPFVLSIIWQRRTKHA